MSVHIEQGNAGHIVVEQLEGDGHDIPEGSTALYIDLDGGGAAVIIDGSAAELVALGQKIISLALLAHGDANHARSMKLAEMQEAREEAANGSSNDDEIALLTSQVEYLTGLVQ